MILIENLVKTYQSRFDVHALKGVNLIVETGKVHGIIGLSGAGKSSLVRCINLLEKPTSGKIFLNDLEVTSLNKKELRSARKKIGLIFQNFNLIMNKTVYANIALPLKIVGHDKKYIDNRVDELLKLVGLEEKKHSYPSQLSGGQKQRVGVARALANEPEVLICDEATSALDPSTTKSILKLLSEINKSLNMTIIIITHEMDVIKQVCDNVSVLENGLIVEEGEVCEILVDPMSETSKTFFEKSVIETIDNKDIDEEGNKVKKFRLTFVGNNAKKPVLSNLIKKYQVTVNILVGTIEKLSSGLLGSLSVSIHGENQDIEKVIEYLKENNVLVEVL